MKEGFVITAMTTEVKGREIVALVQLAETMSPDGDPRSALIAAVAAATLIGAGVELTRVPGALEQIAQEVSRAAAETAERVLDAAGVEDLFKNAVVPAPEA